MNIKLKKKNKMVIIISTIGLLIFTIILHNNYNFYKEDKENNPEMVLAYTVNGKNSNIGLPNKSDGYTVNSVTCQNGVDARWNNESWGIDINNSNGNSKISCTIDFAKTPICKRATILHTAICNRNSAYCSNNNSEGQTIVYGNLGTKGILVSGDAFDCDVNGDGVYDSETERFYYVNDYYDTENKTFNNNVATLIYFDSMTNGVSPASNNVVYSSNISETEYYGPTTVMQNMPTKDQWKNVNLYKTKRNILDETNATKISGFDYSGYSARLLTYQEIKGTNYEFIFEGTAYENANNTIYGPWLETVYSASSKNAWYVGEYVAHLANNEVTKTEWCSARPTIDVLKSDIDY